MKALDVHEVLSLLFTSLQLAMTSPLSNLGKQLFRYHTAEYLHVSNGNSHYSVHNVSFDSKPDFYWPLL